MINYTFDFERYIAAHREHTKFQQLQLDIPLSLEEILVITREV